jgi:mRNA interferase RelE/StbE
VAWTVEVSESALRELDKLDPQYARRILKFLDNRVAESEDPRTIGQALQGAKFGEFWKYRVGDYRLICKIVDERLLVLVLRIGHRREIYR